MFPPNSLRRTLAFLVLSGIQSFWSAAYASAAEPLRAIMLSDEQVGEIEVRKLKMDGVNSIVLQLDGRSKSEGRKELAAAQQIQNSGFNLYYWIEVARCPELADAHPEWMASLQGHSEWRRLFKDFPQPRDRNEVVKNYPWVPILYKEAFEAQHTRIERLLDGKPQATGIFLNDLQGSPSACGCGSTFCRWTTDYGPIKTATRLGDEAASQFVVAVGKLAPESEIVPIWVTECEEHDGARDGLCAGVGCFQGICWKAYSKQLNPVAKTSQRIGVLLPFREFQRDLPLYGEKAAWIRHALKTFQEMPPQHGSAPIAADRLIGVLQGWDVSASDVEAQKRQTAIAGTSGYIVSRVKIDQRWEPRMHRVDRDRGSD